MGRYVLGLDNGGTSTKAAIFDLKGRVKAVYGKNTDMIIPKPGYMERDMEELWKTNCDCIRKSIEKAGIKGEEIVGIAVCGHGKGLYLWGQDDRPAYNGIVSTDGRAWRYPRKWKDAGVYSQLHEKLCQDLLACQQVSLLAWMKDYEEEVYHNIRYVFSVKDYIRYRLTKEAYSEITDLSGSGLMNVREGILDKEVLEKLGIGEMYEKIPPLKYSSEQCGRITKEVEELTGLKEGTAVAGGMFDIDACAVALNVTTPEELCTIAGTWSINEYISQTPVMDGSVAMNSLFAIPGYYLVEECSATSAGNLEWFLENLMEGRSYEEVNRDVERISPEESEVYFLPFLYGSNTHPLGKAGFIGLTSYHRKEHMLRAVFEGVAYSHRMHIERLLKSRPVPQKIRMAGGAVNSNVWVQIFADVLGIPIEVMRGKELGALGGAMAAAIAAGIYQDYQEAAAHMVKAETCVCPDEERKKIYEKKYQKYCRINEALNQVWEEFEI